MSHQRVLIHPLTAALCFVVHLSARHASAEPTRAAGSLAAVQVTRPVPAASLPSLWPFIFGALGLSGISVAATTGFLALNQQGIAEDHCSQLLRLCDDTGRAASQTGRTLRNVSSAGWIIGGLGLGLSAYLVLSPPSQRSRVALMASVEAAGPRAAVVAQF